MGSVSPSPEAPVTAAELRAMQADVRRYRNALMEDFRDPKKGNRVVDPEILAEVARLDRVITLLSEFKCPFPPRIESGIPMPARVARDSHPKPKWTPILRRMKVGDSVFVMAKWAQGIVTSAHRIGIRTSRDFTGLKVRIWRTS